MKNKLFIAFSAVVFLMLGCEESTRHTVVDESIQNITAATPTKEYHYFRVMWNNDAASTATIGWTSKTNPKDQRLYIDTVDHKTDVSKYALSYAPSVQNTFLKINNTFVRLTNLKPNTRYYFVVADKKSISERYWFETASDSTKDDLSLVIGGDSRNNRLPRQQANILVSKLHPHAVVFGGDMVESGVETQWRDWLEDWQLTISAEGRITPIIAARGNHERSDSVIINFFDTPKGVYYGVNLNNGLLRVYTLNSENSIAGNQSTWLQQDLIQNSNTLWKIAQYHKPMRPHVSSKGDGDLQYKYWAKLFYDHRVQLVSESDAHTMKTTWPLAPCTGRSCDSGFVRNDDRGTVYIGEGCWGAPLRNADNKKTWTRESAKFNHFHWVFLSEQRMEVRTVKIDNGSVVESLTPETRFNIPKNIQIWTSQNGSVMNVKR